MKKSLFILLITSVFFSCSEDFDPDEFPQVWQLTEMGSVFPASTSATGDDMEWQETYVLNPDNTFVKTRDRDGSSTSESGTFSLETINDEEFIRFTYDSDNSLIGNCTGLPEEFLRTEGNDRLASTWQACDGPVLIYERIE